MKILVTGANGLVGSALRQIASLYPQHQFGWHTHFESGDLKDPANIERSLLWKPDAIIHCAALVGGIAMNRQEPAHLLSENLLINTTVFEAAKNHRINKLIAFSSACAFPDVYPMREDMLHDGAPFVNNYAYGYAKRMVDIQIRAYNEQYGFKWKTLIPTSIYGPHDNFGFANGHFVGALIHRAYVAKNELRRLLVWGTGKPMRELLFSEDLANVILKLLESDLAHDKYIISSGEEVSIADVANTVTKIIGMEGDVQFSPDMPDGQFRKPTDTARMRSVLGDFKFTPYEEGLKKTIEWFLANYPNVKT